jgi:sugar phosphate isomerase/epimerase
MSREVSLAHLTLIDVSPPELVQIAADAGFDAVGLRISPAGPDDQPYEMAPGSNLLRETRRRMDETGLRVLDAEVARLDAGTDVDTFAPVIETAAELGARFLLVNVYDEDDAWAASRFAQLCEMAAPAGIRPVLEPMPYSGIRTLDKAVAVVRGSGGGVLIDPLHLRRGGGSPEDVARLAPALTPYVQLCDARKATPPDGVPGLVRESRHDRLPPLHGELELGKLLRALGRPDAPISVEAPSSRLRARYGDQEFARLLRRSVDAATLGGQLAKPSQRRELVAPARAARHARRTARFPRRVAVPQPDSNR